MDTAHVQYSTEYCREGKEKLPNFSHKRDLSRGKSNKTAQKKPWKLAAFPWIFFSFSNPPLSPRSLCLARYGLQHGPRSVSSVSPPSTKPASPPQKKEKKTNVRLSMRGHKKHILSFTDTQYRTRGGGASTEGERDRATKKEERKIDVEGHLSR